MRGHYEKCADREAWVSLTLSPDGVYCGRPKNDGGWYRSSTVKAGSMFANPFTLIVTSSLVPVFFKGVPV